MFDLTSKTALVTGASRGIGRAIALALAGQGADVAIHFHAREDAAREVAQFVEDMGRRAPIFSADARSGAALQTLWKEAEAALGPLDILVNNAGLLKNSFLAMTSEATWDEVLDVNLKAAFQLSKLAARSMSPRKSGRIINISSQAGQMGDVMRADAGGGLDQRASRNAAASRVTRMIVVLTRRLLTSPPRMIPQWRNELPLLPIDKH